MKSNKSFVWSSGGYVFSRSISSSKSLASILPSPAGGQRSKFFVGKGDADGVAISVAVTEGVRVLVKVVVVDEVGV